MFNLLHFIDENKIVLSRDKACLNPVIQVVFGLDVFERLLFLVNENDIDIRIILVTLHKVFENKAFANAARANQGDDVAFAYPRIHNVRIVLPCKYFHFPLYYNRRQR